MRRIQVLLATMVTGVLLASGLALAATTTFENSSTITINDSLSPPTEASPYPSQIEVSGLSTDIEDVNLTLKGYSHIFPDDVGVLVVGPQGQKALVMSDVGFAHAVSGINLTLDDEAAGSLPDFDQITAGTYKPTQGTAASGQGDPVPANFPSPAPTGPYGTQLSVFDGTDPNGTWKLYAIDDTADHAGSISGWSLDISDAPADTTSPSVSCSARPSRLKPPNHKLVAINTSVSVTDSGSGPAGFALLSVTSNQADSGLGTDDVPNDIQGWTTGTNDTSGQLRAERYGGTRIYTLTYQGKDAAGNTKNCKATVRVPKG